MLDRTIIAILTAGRSALARSGSDSRLRRVAATYAQAALQRAPDHPGATALLQDVHGEVARSPEYAEWLRRHGRGA